jgi:ferredoxin, 2Fe-2S
MTSIRFTQPDETEREVTASDGESLMRVALREDIRGIVGECGGELTCGTCHIYIAGEWRESVGGPSEDEEALLEDMEGVRPESRLACQVKVRPELDGLRCTVSRFQ